LLIYQNWTIFETKVKALEIRAESVQSQYSIGK